MKVRRVIKGADERPQLPQLQRQLYLLIYSLRSAFETLAQALSTSTPLSLSSSSSEMDSFTTILSVFTASERTENTPSTPVDSSSNPYNTNYCVIA